jgi:hypothetical protein
MIMMFFKQGAACEGTILTRVKLHARIHVIHDIILLFNFYQAYSKDGLAAAANNDPETRAKMEVHVFIFFPLLVANLQMLHCGKFL